jgi:imidazolonepropionase-like amidohydrolase
MPTTVLICARLFDGLSEALSGPTEILVENGLIADVGQAVARPRSATVTDLGDRTVMPGFIDTHVHLCLDGLHLREQVLECSATKALVGLHLAQQYLRHGFTTLRDMGTLDPDWPTINLRDAIEKGLVHGPRLIVAAHMISATGGHADMQGAFPCRHLSLSKVADSPARIREMVRADHAFGGDWIKTMNTGGYMSFGDDPARVTWFEDEMQCLAETRASARPARRGSHGCGRRVQAGITRRRPQPRALLPDR